MVCSLEKRVLGVNKTTKCFHQESLLKYSKKKYLKCCNNNLQTPLPKKDTLYEHILYIHLLVRFLKAPFHFPHLRDPRPTGIGCKHLHQTDSQEGEGQSPVDIHEVVHNVRARTLQRHGGRECQ